MVRRSDRLTERSAEARVHMTPALSADLTTEALSREFDPDEVIKRMEPQNAPEATKGQYVRA